MPTQKRKELHGTKHGFHPAFPVVLGFVGASVVSVVFGMLIFPAFADVCASELLYAVSKVGYVGLIVVLASLLLESYHLYEHHKKHVSLLVVLSFVVVGASAVLMNIVTSAFSC